MWKIAWGVVLGLILWHCLPVILGVVLLLINAALR